jgi:3-deoxy-D-manno-octulosonic-acid transferase
MVRYDLFPEFLLWAMKPGHDLKIIWMTFKKERSKGRNPSFWKKLFLKQASTVVYAGVPDQKTAAYFGLKGEAYDFRMEQIYRRIQKKEEKFRSLFPLYPDFRTSLSEKRVIIGNAWPSDLFLLRDLPADYQIVIVPHQLSQEILDLFREGLDGLGREVFELNDSTTEYRSSPTVLVNKKGILCELYADFPHSYVGGGFEGSIHSVLEPLIAGSGKIACGPFHHRSTEYDVALDLEKMTEVNTPEQFMDWLKDAPKDHDHAKIESLLKGYRSVRELVISC